MDDGKQPAEMNSIVRWADAGMYGAEPMEADVMTEHGVLPKVYLLWQTPHPLRAIAAMNAIYRGKVVRNMMDITNAEAEYDWDQVMNAHLEAPLEAVKFHFLIEGVDRAFTHQLVRQRTAVYAQESLRFAVKESAGNEVVIPPHIAALAPDAPQRRIWDDALAQMEEAYDNLVNSGIPAEDARALLPTATATRVHYITDLRGLKLHAGNRLCTQAQFHWRMVFAGIISAIRNYPGEDKYVQNYTERWQQRAIADSMLFRPVCFHLNRCPWQDDIAKTRKCSIKDRVTTFADHGIPSSRWEEERISVPFGDEAFEADYVQGIKPQEWLMNPDAAIRRPDGKGVKHG